jgi:aspartate aminotransferase
MKFSSRIENIEASKTVSLSALISQLRSEGKDIISLNVGEPDFHTDEHIKKATIEAIKENKTKYSLVPGVLELRSKIAKASVLDINEKNILVANGSKQIIFSVLQTICDVENEIIVFRPYWVTIPESVKLAGGKPVFVDTKDNQLDIEALEKSITKKTKAIFLNTPNNPTGAVYPKSDLEKVAEIAKRHDLYIISDEAYDQLTYDGHKHYSIASLSKEIFDRTITIKSFSKTYCMTGYRIGYMIANEKIISAVNKLQSHLTGNNCTFAQYGAIAAMDLHPCVIEKMVTTFESRAKLSYDLFSQLFECEKPQGAFYLFCNIKKYLGKEHKNCEEFTSFILNAANVALVCGSAFGSPGYMRISFAASEKDITMAYERIKAIL